MARQALPPYSAARRDALGLRELRTYTRGLIPKGTPADLIVFDTLANLWPVKDENSAAEVGAALAPQPQLCKSGSGRAVLLVHHLRTSDGAEGTGSPGSGALAGFVDVILELRRAKPDPTGRRTLTGYGRHDAIPAEWVVELTENEGKATFVHKPGREDSQSDTRFDWIDAVPPGKRREEVVAGLAEAGHAMKAKTVQSCLRADKEGRWLAGDWTAVRAGHSGTGGMGTGHEKKSFPLYPPWPGVRRTSSLGLRKKSALPQARGGKGGRKNLPRPEPSLPFRRRFVLP